MLTIFVDPGSIVKYLHGTGVRVIRHSVVLDGQEVELLTCQFKEEDPAPDIEPSEEAAAYQHEAVELSRQLDVASKRNRELEAMIIEERKKAQG